LDEIHLNIKTISSTAPDIREQVTTPAGKGVDVVIDCVGAENTIRDYL
jgi:threonine dehydrogenase-like Zn-dependent dehydrogenase